MDRYLTIARDAETEIEVKRSRFRARMAGAGAEEDARAVVEAARKEHWDARHHCSAFVIGPAGEIQRSSDDGEPAGTAGMPMLEVLRGAGVSDVVVVVTRWFGGVLLGTGGLVRAYSEAVSAVLEQAGRRERRLVQDFSLALPHAEAGRVENDLRARGVLVAGTDYGALATLRLAVPAGEARGIGPVVAELTGGRGEPVPGAMRWE